MWCRARYLTPDINGETRQDRNARFEEGDKTPEWSVPDGGQYLVDWFDDLCKGHNRVVGGQVKRISWSEMLAWRDLTQNLVYPHEFEILRAMDLAVCEGLSDEVQYASAQLRQKAIDEAKNRQTG